ncbi:hypothetical protein JTE90_011448 [Oedothorax gibbosus]|uniref:Apple domain-containing protein n=1 Tax=Oedothorax gibbosus TaxID=931172 RepID=A0AAV6VD72_9ARAC|nr:hypothetical protein JTE90_011448 [Oedothorax gibbosus]
MRWRGVAAVLCWLVHVNSGCETGVAHVGSVLSVPRSLLANADVALLQEYSADSLAQCMEECCTGKYGSCTIASFKSRSTKKNCMHFNCRPLTKCKFLSSNSTDTFSFSSQPPTPKHDPKTTPPTIATKEDIVTFPNEKLALKNDNTTVKPRKGVEEDPHSKSGVKPRKGVSNLDVPHSELLSAAKSNVKPRKGVTSDPTEVPGEPLSEIQNSVVGISSKDLMSELENVFADDVTSVSVEPTSSSAWTSGVEPTMSSTKSAYSDHSDSSMSHTRLIPSYTTEVTHSVPSSTTKTLIYGTMTRQFVSAAVEEIIASTPTSALSFSTAMIRPSKASTLGESSTLNQQSPTKYSYQKLEQHQSLLEKESPTKLGQSSTDELSLQHNYHPLETGLQHNPLGLSPGQKLVEDEETARDRKYKSSMHLVLSLVFGLLVLFAVLGVVAKRVYDGWLRRDYHKMNYLIDGIYDGVD